MLLVISLFFITAGASVAQNLPEVESQPQAEERLRQNLQKLDHWGVMQLLRTERDVDKKQKHIARASTHPDELALLAEDEDSGVRFYVAVNRYTPLDVKMLLSFDTAAHVRAGVALTLVYDPLSSEEVKSATEKIALHLTQDTQPLVRLGLASNPQLSNSIYDLLTQDSDPLIRQKLAENPNIPQSTLSALAQDSIIAVQIQALGHRNMPRDILEKMESDPSPLVRLAVCRNRNTPMAVLESLAEDPDVRIREAVADHPATPSETLRKMAEDQAINVVIAVARHPHADRHLLLDLAADPRDLKIRQEAQNRLVPLLRGEIREDILERWRER